MGNDSKRHLLNADNDIPEFCIIRKWKYFYNQSNSVLTNSGCKKWKCFVEKLKMAHT